VAWSRVTLEEYYALEPGDLIRHGIHESSGFFTCMVEEAFDGEAIVLAINPTERIFETHFSFWPSEAPWSERIA